MGNGNGIYQCNYADEAGKMTVKEKVLKIYPDASLMFNDGKNIGENNRNEPPYYLVTWSKQSINQFIRAYAQTEREAWKRAWKSIQQELLAKFENS